MNDKKYRHEYKFILSNQELFLMETRLNALLKKDIHTGEKGKYLIRSIYFDTKDNIFVRQNEEGIDPRGKYRIRTYNRSNKKIVLEYKEKRKGMTFKESEDISFDECMRFMQGKGIECNDEERKLLQYFNLCIKAMKLQPKVIVEYERIPFVDKRGNVRITIDKNICSSNYIAKYFDRNIAKRPVLPKGMNLMEIKYDEFLPGYIRQELEIGRLSRITFSKYYLSRRYGLSESCTCD